MKLLALVPLLLMTAAPANALTWKEFWEPFDGHGHGRYTEQHYHHYYERPKRRRVCTEEVYREVRNRRGHFVEYYYETVRVPCRYRRY
jgi:hypothetical protein